MWHIILEKTLVIITGRIEDDERIEIKERQGTKLIVIVE